MWSTVSNVGLCPKKGPPIPTLHALLTLWRTLYRLGIKIMWTHLIFRLWYAKPQSADSSRSSDQSSHSGQCCLKQANSRQVDYETNQPQAVKDLSQSQNAAKLQFAFLATRLLSTIRELQGFPIVTWPKPMIQLSRCHVGILFPIKLSLLEILCGDCAHSRTQLAATHR